jgi:hypothetical protein
MSVVTAGTGLVYVVAVLAALVAPWELARSASGAPRHG